MGAMIERPAGVADGMRGEVVTIRPEASLDELARLFLRRKVSGVPVVDAQGKAVGTVSAADLAWLGGRIRPAAGARPGDSPWAGLDAIRVYHLMTPSP